MRQVFLPLVIMLTAWQLKAQDTRVVLEVGNVNTKKGGATAVAVFDRHHFLKMGKQIRAASKEVDAEKMRFVFNDLPPGEYAFVAFQDIDRNNSLKKNFIGYPIEPFGISNNPRMLFGPPSFDDAKLNLQAKQNVTVRIRLN